MNMQNVTMPILISVIIPFYNRIPLVLESIQSVLDQTYPYFEILLVDDGSTEDTSAILEIAQSDERIHLINGLHQGVSAARNLALEHVKGEYIAFLDSDDIFMPEKLAIQLDYMQANHLYFSHTSYVKMDMEGRMFGIAHSGAFSGAVYPSIIGMCPLATPTIMVRSEVFLQSEDRFKRDFHIGEDVCLWIDLASKYEFGGLDIALSKVRNDVSSAANAYDKQLIGLSNIYNYCRKHPLHGSHSAQLDTLEEQMQNIKESEQAYIDFENKYKAEQSNRLQLEKEFTQRGFMPLVSIIIPVYNGGDYLSEAIESALMQTYPNTEIIVINDGSKDGGLTERIALRYGDLIRYIAKPNGGVASALNRGIAEMKGDYFSWLSHDDLYTKDKVESQIRLLLGEKDKTRIVCGGYDLFTESPDEVFAQMDPWPENGNKLSIPLYPLFRGLLNGCTMLIHKSHFERVGGFDVNLPTTQDYDLWFRMLRGQSVVFQKDIHMKSRSHPRQGSKTMAHKKEAMELWRNMMDSVTESECIQMDGDVFSFYYNLYEFLHLNMPDNIHAWGHAKRKAIDFLLKQIGDQDAEENCWKDLQDPFFVDLRQQISSMALQDKQTDRIALIRFGLEENENYNRVMRQIQQMHPDKEYCFFRILREDEIQKAEQMEAFVGVTIPLSKLDTDTLSAIMALMQVDLAFEFLSTDEAFMKYCNLSICDNRFVMIHDYDRKSIVKLPYNCLEDAWAVIAMNDELSFLDCNYVPKWFMYTYKFACNLKEFISMSINSTVLLEETAVFSRLKTTDEKNLQNTMDNLMEMLFERPRVVAVKEVDSFGMEEVIRMKNTTSWKITKPLRMLSLIRQTLKREGMKGVLRMII